MKVLILIYLLHLTLSLRRYGHIVQRPQNYGKINFIKDPLQTPEQQSYHVNPALIEGDILQPQATPWKGRQNSIEVQNNSTNQIKALNGPTNRMRTNSHNDPRWTYHIIPYTVNFTQIPENYRENLRLRFQYTMEFEYRHKLGDCIQFCEYHKCPAFIKKQKDYLKINFEDNGCWSYVGRQHGGQEVSLDWNGCLNHGTIAHELMHALGFPHEQSRSIRDSFVKIEFQNIIPSRKSNFVKDTSISDSHRDFDSYDYESVMHYNEYAFSRSSKRTIFPNPKHKSSWTYNKDKKLINKEYNGHEPYIGQRVGLSFCDELKIRRYYSLPGMNENRICLLWNERTCRCPHINPKARTANDDFEGYDSSRCQNMIQNDAMNVKTSGVNQSVVVDSVAAGACNIWNNRNKVIMLMYLICLKYLL